ncbi:GNAT family N-acetyltransferase [Neobacillus terrae]|uniref:GNAT family N-acetyltransferase n=1 Tax=Neobacillus terrae TaxID=3034837 RepID=UPI001FB0F143|nr:GNAT family N-acetyltransferase [Neobacillus terrae]
MAEKEAQLSGSKAITPLDLLLVCLQEKTGVLWEISLKINTNLGQLRGLAEAEKDEVHQSPFFRVPVDKEVNAVFAKAVETMNRYNQVYLNEGHFLKALMNTEMAVNCLTDRDRNTILELGTKSRDMITNLDNYHFPELSMQNIRRVNHNDFDEIVRYVEEHFSSGWAQTVREGFLQSRHSIYVAFDNEGGIAGFAAFDIYKGKKGYFGPMGVSHSDRSKGYGFSLLHHCLKDMKGIGYAYAIIGGAGPLEFYEKACGAVIIPKGASSNL